MIVLNFNLNKIQFLERMNIWYNIGIIINRIKNNLKKINWKQGEFKWNVNKK